MLKARQNLSQSQTPSDYPVKAEVGVFLSYSHYPHSCSSTHMQRSRSENLSSWWKEEEVENDSHTSGGRVLPHCLCLLHVIMLTQCGDRNQHKHDCCFTCHHHPRRHLEITASESKLLPDKPAQGMEQTKVQGCRFKIPSTSATMKSSCPLPLPPDCSFISPGHLPLLACLNKAVEGRTNSNNYFFFPPLTAWFQLKSAP